MNAHDNPAQYVENYIGYTFNDYAILEEAVSQFNNRRLNLGDKVVGLLLLDAWYGTQESCGML